MWGLVGSYAPMFRKSFTEHSGRGEMLTRFEVEGFRNFDRKFVLDLSQTRDYRFNTDAIEDGVVSVGLIYGRNAIGKTNLCNALFDISRNVGKAISYPNQANYLSADADTTFAKFRYVFRFGGDSVDYCYSKKGIEDYLEESLSINDKLVYRFDHKKGSLADGDLSLVGAQNLNWGFKDPGISILNYICHNIPVDRGNLVFKLFLFARSMDPIGDEYLSNRQFVSHLVDKVIESNLVPELQSFLDRFGIHEGLVVRETPSGDRVLYFKKDRLIPFAQNCSSGTVALLRLFNYFHTVDAPALLFVDEFDAFYHHDLAEAVVGYFKEQHGRQILCASHNTDLFSNKVLRPDCLFILSDNKIISAADATQRELREGHNLEKLYKAGEFDA